MIRITPPPLRITPPRTTWGSRVEQERRNRIRLAVYAYAYELRDESLVTDHEFDQLARIIDPTVTTGNPVLDQFFRDHYQPDSGMWIHHHPDLDGIAAIYHRYYIQ